MLERRGFKDRAWAVEWESSALEFLLEKGFSPEMGARPLKRAIEQYVIAPLAATIVERRFPEGEQFVFVRSDGQAIQAEFVDPDSDVAAGRGAPSLEARGAPASLVRDDPGAGGSAAEFEGSRPRRTASSRRSPSPDWEELKRRLSDEMNAAEFWHRPGSLREAGAAGADGPRGGGRRNGEVAARAARAGRSRREHYSRELVVAARAAAAPGQAGHQGRLRRTRRSRSRSSSSRRSSRAQATAAHSMHGAGSCSTCIAPGRASGICR